jgi:flagella basal body P-ring formation protein FlgA
MILPTYHVWEDWEVHQQKKAAWVLMKHIKPADTISVDQVWEHMGTFNTYEDAHRMKRVAEQCGEIHVKAMIRLLQ